ncbi:hypothetical protein Nepgr_003718 [Nepenthes gracilis]|uniref:Uncharacterized protein n=1 Tax=Nepenthes gracilis TaxID=150966 RepID=A0AAD3S063_NEPGR|nr:hypothetical protein Nepgr_003718 [Nepenthes gracilis]
MSTSFSALKSFPFSFYISTIEHFTKKTGRDEKKKWKADRHTDITVDQGYGEHNKWVTERLGEETLSIGDGCGGAASDGARVDIGVAGGSVDIAGVTAVG